MGERGYRRPPWSERKHKFIADKYATNHHVDNIRWLPIILGTMIAQDRPRMPDMVKDSNRLFVDLLLN
jgi:hypothetical protein